MNIPSTKSCFKTFAARSKQRGARGTLIDDSWLLAPGSLLHGGGETDGKRTCGIWKLGRGASLGIGIWILVLVGGMLAGSALWWLGLQRMERQITDRTQQLGSLRLTGRVPPNRDVMAYLTRRTNVLQQHYEQARSLVAPPVPDVTRAEDPQVMFQERVHSVQRTLERLAAAHGMPLPQQLGFPKELPPAEAVPRFLMQLGLIEGLAESLMTIEGMTQLTSFKAEDPYLIEGLGEGDSITALPVEVHVTCSSPALAKLLPLVTRAEPLMTLERIRVAAPVQTSTGAVLPLEVELVVMRYLIKENTEDQGIKGRSREEQGREKHAT